MEQEAIQNAIKIQSQNQVWESMEVWVLRDSKRFSSEVEASELKAMGKLRKGTEYQAKGSVSLLSVASP